MKREQPSSIDSIKYINLDDLSEELGREYNRIAEGLIDDYHDCIRQLNESNKKDIHWWVTGLASRQLPISQFFEQLAQFFLVSDIIKAAESTVRVKVSSPALARLLRRELGSKLRIVQSSTLRDKIKRSRLYRIYLYLRHCRELLSRYGYSKAYMTELWGDLKQGMIRLVDIFVLNSSFDNTEFEDRYYTGLSQGLSAADKQSLYYFVTWHQIQSYPKTIQKMRRSGSQFIVPEGVLSISDLLKVMSYPFRLRRYAGSTASIRGVDVSELIREDLRRHQLAFGSWLGMAKYYAIRRLKKRGVRIAHALSWLENQNHDKGFHYGLRTFYPDTPTQGYQGCFRHKYYFCMCPTEQEKDSKVIPEKVATFGQGLQDDLSRYSKSLSVGLAPAFRMNHVWDSISPPPGDKVILLALPGLKASKEYALEVVLDYFEKEAPTYSLWVKPHPIAPLTSAERARVSAHRLIESGSFFEYLNQCHLLITGASSVSLEAMAKGVPVITIADKRRLFLNVIPDGVPDALHRIVQSKEELASGVEYFLTESDDEYNARLALSQQFRQDFFQPYDADAAKRLLGL